MHSVPTIRIAEIADLAAVERLVSQAGESFDDATWTTVPGRRYALVIDAPYGGLAAAAQLAIEGRIGRVLLLAIAPRFAGTGLEDRIIAVCQAISRAFGADTLDVLRRRAA